MRPRGFPTLCGGDAAVNEKYLQGIRNTYFLHFSAAACDPDVEYGQFIAGEQGDFSFQM
jgi:hypothetical protein